MTKRQQLYSQAPGRKDPRELRHDIQMVQQACHGDEASKQQVLEVVYDRVWKSLSFLSNNVHDGVSHELDWRVQYGFSGRGLQPQCTGDLLSIPIENQIPKREPKTTLTYRKITYLKS